MLFTVGDFLKNIRTERGVSLEQVSNATHIKIRFLEALENNHYGMLPSEVQAKGFLRLYAGFLDIPEYPIIEAWTNRGSLRVTRTGQEGEDFSDFRFENDIDTELPSDDSSTSTENDSSFSTTSSEISSDERIQDDARFSDADDDLIPLDLDEPSVDPSQVLPSPPDSKRIFRDIGILLKNQREALGLTREEIERYTHIRIRNLDIIENGFIDQLPSPVQAQGMLSNYARFLEVDHDRLLGMYADGLQTSRMEKLAEQIAQKQSGKRLPLKQQPAWRQFITPDLLIGSSLILVLLAISIWSVAQVTNTRAKAYENQITPPSIAEVLMITPSYLPPILTETAMAAVTPTRRHSDYDTGLVGNQSTGVDANLPDAALPPFENNDPLQLFILPNQRAWMRITSDSEIVFDGRVVPGNTYQFSGQNRLNLLSGNASALTVYFNQQNLGDLGILGQVLNMDFTIEGIITPTALPSQTPTATPPQTETPSLPTEVPATPTITPFIP